MPAWIHRCRRGALVLLVAAGVLVASGLLATAQAGWRTEHRCCCPSVADCKCPTHDQPAIDACGNSSILALTPPTLALMPPAPAPIMTIMRVAIATPPLPVPRLHSRIVEPAPVPG